MPLDAAGHTPDLLALGTQPVHLRIAILNQRRQLRNLLELRAREVRILSASHPRASHAATHQCRRGGRGRLGVHCCSNRQRAQRSEARHPVATAAQQYL